MNLIKLWIFCNIRWYQQNQNLWNAAVFITYLTNTICQLLRFILFVIWKMPFSVGDRFLVEVIFCTFKFLNISYSLGWPSSSLFIYLFLFHKVFLFFQYLSMFSRHIHWCRLMDTSKDSEAISKIYSRNVFQDGQTPERLIF